MADIESPIPVEGTPAEDIDMEESAETGAGAGEEVANVTEMEPETPKLVLFAE